MPEVVPVVTPDESQVHLDALPESDEAPATPAFDEATYKKKIQGYTQAITAAKKEAEAARSEAAALAKWKAEREQADMTEFEKAQARIASLEAEAQQARAEAATARLSAQYPLAAEVLGDDISRLDVTKVAELDGRLAKEQATQSEPEPRVDPNNPRRTVPKPPPNDLQSAKQALTDAGNPYFDDSAWGSTNPR
jgi:hypothetical protein